MNAALSRRVRLVLFVLPLVGTGQAHAQRGVNGSDRCDSALLPQLVVSSATLRERIAWLSIITEETYEQAKAEGALELIIEDLPIGASYQQFDEKRREFSSMNRLRLDREEARAVFRQSLTESQLEHWTTCMTSGSPGVRIVMRNDDAGGVTAEVHYVDSPGRKKRFRVTVAGGTPRDGASLRFKLDSGGSQGIMVARSGPTEKITLLVNGRNMTDSAVSVPPPPQIPPEVSDCTDNVLLSAEAHVDASSNPRDAFRVTDGTDLNWNALAPAPQHIEIDLGSSRRIRLIRLNPEQAGGGATQHRLTGGVSNGTEVVLGEFNGVTISGGVVTVPILRERGDGIRRVRVETVSTTGFVSWREIEVFGCD